MSHQESKLCPFCMCPATHQFHKGLSTSVSVHARAFQEEGGSGTRGLLLLGCPALLAMDRHSGSERKKRPAIEPEEMLPRTACMTWMMENNPNGRVTFPPPLPAPARLWPLWAAAPKWYSQRKWQWWTQGHTVGMTIPSSHVQLKQDTWSQNNHVQEPQKPGD